MAEQLDQEILNQGILDREILDRKIKVQPWVSSITWRYTYAPVKHVASSQWPPTISPEGRAAAMWI